MPAADNQVFSPGGDPLESGEGQNGDGTGGRRGGGRGDNEYSMGHVDGGRRIEEGRVSVIGEPYSDTGGHQARKSGEGHQSAGSIGFRKKMVDAVRQVE